MRDGVLTMALLTMALLNLLRHACRSRFKIVYNCPKERTYTVSVATVSTVIVE